MADVSYIDQNNRLVGVGVMDAEGVRGIGFSWRTLRRGSF